MLLQFGVLFLASCLACEDVISKDDACLKDREASTKLKPLQLPEQLVSVSDIDPISVDQASEHELMVALQVSTKTVVTKAHEGTSLEHLVAKSAKQEGDREQPLTLSATFCAAFDTLRLPAVFMLLAIIHALVYPQPWSKTAQLTTSSLSGFRLVLAIWVFLEHAGMHKINGGTSFIVLSSCVLSLARREEIGVVKTSLLSIDTLSKFYVSRFARVLPLYYCYLAYIRAYEQNASQGILVFTIQVLRELVMLPMHQWKEMLLIQLPNNVLYSHLWFIQTIVVMYLLYPLLERLALGPATAHLPATQQRVYLVILACIALKILVCAWMLGLLWSNGFIKNDVLFAWYTWRGISLYSLPLLRIPEFVLGIMIPHVSLGSLWRGTCLCALADALFVGFILSAFAYRGFPVGYILTDMNMQSPLVALIIWAMCFGPVRSCVGKVLSSKFLVTMGELSFGVYIYHPTILRQMGLFNFRNLDYNLSITCWQALPVALAISFIFSWITFCLVEMPSQRLAHWLLQERSACQPTPENTNPPHTLESLASVPHDSKSPWQTKASRYNAN